MTNLRKLIGIIPKILFTLMLALALISVTSCENMLGDLLGQGSTQGGTEPSNPDDGNTQPTEPTTPPKNHYSDYANFNPADYVIENESGKPDSDLEELNDLIWLMYAENEHVGDWMANYVKTNKIKTVLWDNKTGKAWVVGGLEQINLSVDYCSNWLSQLKELDIDTTILRRDIHVAFTHETMHLFQNASGDWFSFMTGMRPDICAATWMLMEFLPWFYTDERYSDAYVYADMQNAVETQSKYIVLSTDPDAYDAARAKDPSLPPFIHSTPWFNNYFSGYAETALSVGSAGNVSMAPPLIRASKEDVLKIARFLLACRDPKQAGVTDEALWTVFEVLRKASLGESKYLRFDIDHPDDWGSNFVRRETFDKFQESIAEWEAAFAAQ